MSKIFFSSILLSLIFIACTERKQDKANAVVEKNAVITDTGTISKIDYTNWKIAKTENIQFKYPDSWQVDSGGNSNMRYFKLSGVNVISTDFPPIQIWRFSTGNSARKVSYDQFSDNVTYEYFIHETDGKNGNMISREPSTFKDFQANKFEYIKNGKPVEIILINGVNRYFMLVNFKDERLNNISEEIFNSVVITK